MSNYRGPQPQRQARQQAEQIYKFAGETGTWRKFVSATTGNPVIGLGSAVYYQERPITAHLYGQPGMALNLPENATMAGMLAVGQFLASTTEPLGRQDELIWRGVTYRVDGDTVPNHIAGTHTVIVKRGN